MTPDLAFPCGSKCAFESPSPLPLPPSVQRPVSLGTPIARATLWSQAAAGCGGPAGLLIVLKS